MELKEYLASITAAEREISLLSTPGTVSYNNKHSPPPPASLHNVYNVVITRDSTVSFSLYWSLFNIIL